MPFKSQLGKLESRDYLGAAIGFCVGFISGLFGIGGGVLTVPAFMLLAKLPQRLAHGSALLPGVFLATAGASIYITNGSVNWAAAGLVLAGSAWGVMLGTRLLAIINLRLLMFVFVVVTVLGALRLILGEADIAVGYEFSLLVAGGFVVTGLLAGTMSGLLGIGGGVVMVPIFIILLEFTAVDAKGTSLMIIIPTSLVGVYRNYKHGNVDLRIGIAAGLGGIPMALLGAVVSSQISEALGQLLFGLLLAAVSVRMLYKAFTMDAHSELDLPESAVAAELTLESSGARELAGEQLAPEEATAED